MSGKFLSLDGEKLWVRGVTYGSFRPRADGEAFPDDEVVEWDFAAIAAAGLNAVRTYTVPPLRLLETAAHHGLRVMVGLPWEQHVAFLDDPDRTRSIERRVRAGVRACAGHPAVLCFAIGNEIPAPIVRWHGRRRVERFIERLYRAAKSEDPDALVTYVNFPSTEYLDLPFVDLCCFNVYLEERERLESYLARLHNLAGNRPLLLAEIGLDSRRNGEDGQAQMLDWHVRTAAAAGCAGAFAFAWTDEWHRGGHDVEDWDFGLTRRDRSPKPALMAVGDAFCDLPPRPDSTWPRVSVVVCSCNGADRLRDCFDGLMELDYPNHEIIVVDDGSTDETAGLASAYPFTVIQTANRGLSNARNTGLAAATGEIVAYLDDDARPDPDWLTYLAHTFMTSDYAGVGGPNIAPGGDGAVADCVANTPGGPKHILLTDTEAEHIPGCNMAFRKESLEAVGGFDPQFRVAGDDVDICWRLRQQGWRLGFAPAAMVWHHARKSLYAFWRQQRGYGKAEALLERKWPEKYNAAGDARWGGHLYGSGPLHAVLPKRPRIYYGTWGMSPFQQLYRPADGALRSAPLMPEWYLLLASLVGLSALGVVWRPFFLVLPLLVAGIAVVIAQAVRGARRARFEASAGKGRALRLRALTAGLYVAQPIARLVGRLRHGLTPWRRRSGVGGLFLRPRTVAVWSEEWRSVDEWLAGIEARLLGRGVSARRAREHDRWDMEIRGGVFGRVRVRAAVEEHGAGRQMGRFRLVAAPAYLGMAITLTVIALAACAGAAAASAPAAAAALAVAGLLIAGRLALELSTGAAALTAAIRNDGRPYEQDNSLAAERSPEPTNLVAEVRRPREARRRLGGRHRAPRIRTWARVAAETRGLRLHLLLLLTLSALVSGLVLLVPVPLKIAVDTVLGSHPVPAPLEALLPDGATSSDSAVLISLAILFLLVTLLMQLVELALLVLSAFTGQKLSLRFRSKLFAHVQRLSFSYHDTRGTLDSNYRIQWDAPALQYIAVDGSVPLVSAALTVAGMLVVTFVIDWQLAVVAVTITPVLIAVLHVYGSALRRQWHEAKALESSAFAAVQEALGALRVVKAFGSEDRETARFVGRSRQSMRANVRVAVTEGLLTMAVGLTIGIGTALVLYIGVRRVQAGSLTLGELLVVMTYLTQLYEPLRTIAKKIGDLQASVASAERVFAVLDESPDLLDRPGARPLRRAAGAVEFRNVTFGYQEGRPVLSDFSLEVPVGTSVGIAGVTGAGKTTLAGLVTRFYDPRSGQVLLDSVDLRDYRLADLRNQFAIVLQEPVLFSASIGENIRYGRVGASGDEVVAAAKAANVHEFILGLPEGYETPVGERGMRLSGGERQRIAVARAFLKDAPLLILDEPTSSVDAETETAIMEAMQRLMVGRTTFMIAHRVSTLDYCNARIVLTDGHIAERQYAS